MARRDYISDNLVDIRDRLKQYAKPTETTTDPQLDPAPSASAPAPVQTAIRPPPSGARSLKGGVAICRGGLHAIWRRFPLNWSCSEPVLVSLRNSSMFSITSPGSFNFSLLRRINRRRWSGSGLNIFRLRGGLPPSDSIPERLRGRPGGGSSRKKLRPPLSGGAADRPLLLAGAVILALVLVFIFC
ncbi:MAG: hypothetical protein L6W00_24915 [Lentisphaeria bacterium]|nr:MAG: hypothetical protein L6W00_24915 [Lentisphaeria bacterium]